MILKYYYKFHIFSFKTLLKKLWKKTMEGKKDLPMTIY